MIPFTDLNSQKKLDLVTTVLFFKEEGHNFSSLVRPSSLSPVHRFCSSLPDWADFLPCSGHTALGLPWWCVAPGYHWPQLWPVHWPFGGCGRGEEVRLPISYFCPQLTLSPVLLPTASSSPFWRQTTAAWQWVPETFYSVQYPNILDNCFYSCKTPVIKGG